jgi:hypothetical protein
LAARKRSARRIGATAAGGKPELFENLEARLLMKGGGGGGGGGGGSTPALPTPAIPAGTFDGIGSGPTYVRESFGFAQGTRYKQNGDVKEVFLHTNVNGIRAEYPNNKTETWIAPPETAGGQEWDFAVVGPADPYEAYTPLQDDKVNGYYSDGELFLNGANFLDGSPDLRPNALLPFAAPTASAYTVSADSVAFFGKTAIGFTSSGAVNRNFETSGQAWLEVDFTGNFPAGGSTFVNTFVLHTDGLNGPTVSGVFNGDPTSFNRLALSYDPTNRVVSASINGQTVATVPYVMTSAVKYVGVEGSWYANVDNFAVSQGAVTPLAPAPVVAPVAAATTFGTTPIKSDLLGSSGSVLV